MGNRSRFVRPDVRTLEISDGDTLIVRRRLTAGEERAMFARMYLAGVDGDLKVNPMQTGLARVTAYLLDWSICDESGKPVPIQDKSIEELTQILDLLSPDDFGEIKRAIGQHQDEMDAERVVAKKARGGESMSPVTLPSPDGAAGATTGSAT